MATIPVSLFFQKNKEYGVSSDFGFVNFDLILSESHTLNSTVTTHTIEDGSVIADHIRNELANGSLSGLVSNYSLKSAGVVTNRAQQAFDELRNIRDKKTLVTLTLIMDTYENVVITNIGTSRTGATGDAATFSISFQQVKQVKLKTVVLETSIKLKDMKKKQNKQSAVKASQGRTVGK